MLGKIARLQHFRVCAPFVMCVHDGVTHRTVHSWGRQASRGKVQGAGPASAAPQFTGACGTSAGIRGQARQAWAGPPFRGQNNGPGRQRPLPSAGCGPGQTSAHRPLRTPMFTLPPPAEPPGPPGTARRRYTRKSWRSSRLGGETCPLFSPPSRPQHRPPMAIEHFSIYHDLCIRHVAQQVPVHAGLVLAARLGETRPHCQMDGAAKLFVE